MTTTSTPTVRIPAALEPEQRWNGKRYVPAVKASVGPIAVIARKAEVTALLTEAVTNFLTSYEPPKVYARDGGSAVVYPRHPLDNAVVEWVVQTTSPAGHVRCWSIYRERDAAHAGARRYLADQTCDPHNEASVNATMSWLTHNGADYDEARDYLRSTAFQRAYRVAEARGEADCHRWACEHDGEYLTIFPEAA